MNRRILWSALACVGALARAESPASLPPFTVHSSRVANQAPAASFAMPVSALRYEPRVDIQGRNLVEGQADVTIRGGIFENTGFRIGAVSVLDPQTGHYFAELPIAPVMLAAPEVLTGSNLAVHTTNATVGAVAYGWRPIRSGGLIEFATGPHRLARGMAYQGLTRDSGTADYGVDVAVARSQSDGRIAFGEHRFERLNARVQRISRSEQTDLFVGYQHKFFGWPNLYTPFNSNETENLQTVLLLLNHRIDLGGGDAFTAGAYHRRNKDDYAFNRFAPVGPVHPFQHTTWVSGVAAEARRTLAGVIINARAEVLADELDSTSLTAGPYRSRTLAKFALVPEKSWTVAEGGVVSAKLGATFEDSNRDRGAFSPVFELARTFATPRLRKVHLSYVQTTQEPTYTALNSSATSGLFRGNPTLRRETTHAIEVGASGVLSGFSVEAAVFARRDDALVDWTFRRGVTARSANPVDVETLGFEAVARRSWVPVDIVIGYTALAKDSDYRGAAVDASFYALNYARHRLTAAATLRLGRSFELRIDNAARLQAPNLLRVSGGNDALLTAIALAFRPAKWRGLELSAQVDNVWDSRFQEVPAVPASPRSWSVGASYVW